MTDALSVPRHVGYIVDGNRRWAKSHGLPTYEGHLAGYNALKEVAIATLAQGSEYMSAYVFSTENWKRTHEEVAHIMGLLMRVLQADVPLFNTHNVRLRVLGKIEGMDPKIQKAITQAEAQTAANDGGVFALCINYGGQQELVDATQSLIRQGIAAEEVTAERIAAELYAPEVPPIDIIVRTSGEQRLSNFMLWRAAYSELLFLEKNFPDMTKDDVADILEEYNRRQRRFGG